MQVIIETDKDYALWLAKHLAEEHPKTKGKIKISNGLFPF